MALQYTVLKLLPKNALSRAVGALCRLPGPRPVVQASMRAFVKAFNVDMSEAEFPLEHYPTFTEFFTRRLKAGARPITPGDTLPVSPVDGTVGMCGRIEQGTLVQAKGRTYTLAELVGGPTAKLDAEVFEGGTFVTIYLAPYNYHRIHTPLGGQIQGYCNVPGKLWPVNAVGVENVDKLFCVNERLTTYIESPAGACAVVKVGATNVGRIRALYADVVTNAKMTREVQRVRFERPVEVAKGGEIAMFEMGSTVVLLFQKAFELGEKITLGTPIKLGEPLGKVA